MSRIFLTIAATLILGGTAEAKATLYQCAVDNVRENRGVRVNVIESNGVIRANVIFGTTVSGTMFNVEETGSGYAGEVRDEPDYTLELEITDEPARNSNIDGYLSFLTATIPTTRGPKPVEAELVCGEKISDRWN